MKQMYQSDDVARASSESLFRYSEDWTFRTLTSHQIAALFGFLIVVVISLCVFLLRDTIGPEYVLQFARLLIAFTTLGTVGILSSWLIQRLVRWRYFVKTDKLRAEIKEILKHALAGQVESDLEIAVLKSNPRVTAEEIADVLGECDNARRRTLLQFLKRAGFASALASVKLRGSIDDYRPLIAASALGLQSAWRKAVQLISSSGRSWRWAAGIHALAYWPSEAADYLLVSELAKTAERRPIIDRAFLQPLVGALIWRGSKITPKVMDFLALSSLPSLLLATLIYFSRVPSIDPQVASVLEERLIDIWPVAGGEAKARILETGCRHRLTKLELLAWNALEQEPDFVRLWAARFLSRNASDDSWVTIAGVDSSGRVRMEVEKELPTRIPAQAEAVAL